MDNADGPPAGYQVVEGSPSLDDYLDLRLPSGLSPRRPDRAREALNGGWAALHVIHQSTGTTVGMGRLLGDGGWYFHVLDMAVLPEHQRRGLGDAILGALLAKIRDHAPAGAYVSLMADPPGRRLYERHGIAPTLRGRSPWPKCSLYQDRSPMRQRDVAPAGLAARPR